MDIQQDMDIQHGHGHVEWTCSMGIDMQHKYEHEAWIQIYHIDINMKHRHVYAAQTWTSSPDCSIDMDMQHRHGLAEI
jgi:hypothetical protein